jgi:hypothetical protein
MIRCDRCEFFFAYEPAERPGLMTFSGGMVWGGGECRRHPPRPDEKDIAMHIAKFPIVPLDYWCGEFEIHSRRVATERTTLAPLRTQRAEAIVDTISPSAPQT